MTAFGTGRADTEQGSVTVEVRSVNNRYLDLTLRIPEDLRFAEPRMRDLLGQHARRGKVELKVNYTAPDSQIPRELDLDAIRVMAGQLETVRRWIPDTPAPGLDQMPHLGTERKGLDSDVWLPLCEQACEQALREFQAARAREGERLAQAMHADAQAIGKIVDQVEMDLPILVQQHQERIAQKLREALTAACPDGFSAIPGNELSARIAQEAGLFGLRVDVAEELTRLRAHLQELSDILAGRHAVAARNGSGKRLDFLFQEMNREANTLGSKAAALTVTQAAIDLKLLIEQLREQAQNIE